MVTFKCDNVIVKETTRHINLMSVCDLNVYSMTYLFYFSYHIEKYSNESKSDWCAVIHYNTDYQLPTVHSLSEVVQPIIGKDIYLIILVYTVIFVLKWIMKFF